MLPQDATQGVEAMDDKLILEKRYATLAHMCKIALDRLQDDTFILNPEDRLVVAKGLNHELSITQSNKAFEYEYQLLIGIWQSAWHLCEKHGNDSSDFWRDTLRQSVYEYHAKYIADSERGLQ